MALWTFPVTAPAGDARRNLPVFTISPNWKTGILERLEFLTDVMSSEIAVEQRRAARRYPRRSFEAAFLRTNSDRARIDNFQSGIGRNVFLVPLWHEQFKLGEPLGASGIVTFPAGTMALREFAPNDLVLISNGDPSVYAILTVNAVDLALSRMSLYAPSNVGSWPPGSRITPLRRARLLDQVAMSNPADRVGTSTIRFNLIDSDSRFPASWGYCSPLWRFNPTRATPIDFTYDRSAFFLDMQGGVIDVVDPGKRAQIGQTMDIVLYGREEIWKYRSFLYMARGRARRFYVPTYTNDMVPLTDINGLTFDVKPNGFFSFQSVPQEARRIISIVFKDGRPPIYRNIVGIASVNSGVAPFNQTVERFTIDQPMPPVLARDVERMSFVVPSRFDQDSFEILHVTDNATVIKAAVAVRSSIVDGMPPIECFVTSRPYPVVSIDGLNMTGRVLGGSFRDVRPVDNMDVNARVLASTLKTVLKPYNNYPPEGLDTAANVRPSTLKQVLRTYNNYVPEEIQTSSSVQNSTLRQILLTYIIPAEAIEVSASVIGGTLS